jgi:hypothetical protein
VVRYADPEREPPFAYRLHRQGLLGERDRVPGLDRHHRRADLDPRRLGPNEGGSGQGVELVGDLRDPDGGQARLLRPAGVAEEPLDLRPVTGSLRADHQADSHRPDSLRGGEQL